MSDVGRGFQALLLAAGRSVRMGEAKALLAGRSGRPLVVEAVAELREAGFEPLVVWNPEVRRPDWLGEPPRVVENFRPEEGQLSSVRLGVGALEDSGAGVLVALVDNPGRLAERAAVLRRAIDREPGQPWVAAWQGRPGHPLWLPAGLWPGLRTWQGDGGLRAFLKQAHALPRPVETAIPETLADLDTPERHRAFLEGESPRNNDV